MSDNSNYVISHIQRRKKDLISVFGGECCICHFNAYPQALDFHHVNPNEKEFGITDSGAVTKALEKQLEEMKKCVLVCSNCHRGIHAGLVQIPDNYQELYNQAVADELIKANNERKKGKQFFCKYCGATVYKGNDCCPQCAHKQQRRVERPSREDLKDLIRNNSFLKVGSIFKVSDNAIRKWCKAYGLPSKKTEINLITDEDWALI